MTRIDDTLLRDRLETAIRDHDQVFERFFLARFLDLSFAYLPEAVPDADKTVCRVTFPVTPLILNPQGVVHGGVLATVMDTAPTTAVNRAITIWDPSTAHSGIAEARKRRRTPRSR